MPTSDSFDFKLSNEDLHDSFTITARRAHGSCWSAIDPSDAGDSVDYSLRAGPWSLKFARFSLRAVLNWAR